MAHRTYGTMYYVRDMAKAAAWVRETLGLAARYESPEWTEFDVGGAALCLHHTDDAAQLGRGGMLIVHVAQIRDLVARLKTRGFAVTELKEVHPGAWCADLRDPDGNVLSLYDNGAVTA